MPIQQFPVIIGNIQNSPQPISCQINLKGSNGILFPVTFSCKRSVPDLIFEVSTDSSSSIQYPLYLKLGLTFNPKITNKLEMLFEIKNGDDVKALSSNLTFDQLLMDFPNLKTNPLKTTVSLILIEASFYQKNISKYIQVPPSVPRFCGLVNEGNPPVHCFNNVVLQVLYHTPFIRNFIFQSDPNLSDNPDVHLNLRNLFAQMLLSSSSSRPRAQNPAMVINSFQNPTFFKYQEDSSEYLEQYIFPSLAIDTLPLRCYVKNFPQTPSNSQPFLQHVIPVSISTHDLQSGISNFLENNPDVDLLSSPPDILMVQIDRAVNGRKDDKSIFSFPIANFKLNLPDRQEDYQLYAVICHQGTLEAGHYTCLINPDLSGTWYLFNDDKVTQASPKDIQKTYSSTNPTSHEPTAHILFYAKSSQIPNIFKQIQISSQDLQSFMKFQSSFLKLYFESDILQSINKIEHYSLTPPKQIKTSVTHFKHLYHIVSLNMRRSPPLVRIWLQDKKTHELLTVLPDNDDEISQFRYSKDPDKNFKDLLKDYDLFAEHDLFVETKSKKDPLQVPNSERSVVFLEAYDPSVAGEKISFISKFNVSSNRELLCLGRAKLKEMNHTLYEDGAKYELWKIGGLTPPQNGDIYFIQKTPTPSHARINTAALSKNKKKFDYEYLPEMVLDTIEKYIMYKFHPMMVIVDGKTRNAGKSEPFHLEISITLVNYTVDKLKKLLTLAFQEVRDFGEFDLLNEQSKKISDSDLVLNYSQQLKFTIVPKQEDGSNVNSENSNVNSDNSNVISDNNSVISDNNSN